MFSANENLMLRQDKRRIVGCVEACLPPEALDSSNVMVMQVACRAPGCVPLETAICILFSPSTTEVVPGVPESKNGGTFKTKVLKPMRDVTDQDVKEALPPAFPGGLRSMEKLCLQARDVMLAQITQLVGDEEDVEGKKLMALYLQSCLQEYMERDCVPPEYGEPFPLLLDGEEEETGDAQEELNATEMMVQETGNVVVRRAVEEEEEEDSPSSVTRKSNSGENKAAEKNVLLRRASDAGDPPSQASTSTSSLESTISSSAPSTMDWRRQQNLSKAMSSQSIISHLSEREHAPGVRRPGCPCCDPDHPNNYVDSMMML